MCLSPQGVPLASGPGFLQAVGLTPALPGPQFKSIQLGDAGTYICLAQNALGMAEAQVEVSVESVHGKPGAPEVSVSPTLTVVAGQTAQLHCSATGTSAGEEWDESG